MMSPRPFGKVLLLALLTCAAALMAESISLLKEDFSASSPIIEEHPDDFSLAPVEGRPELGTALKISRPTKVHWAIRLPLEKPALKGHDFTVSCDYQGIGYLFVVDANKKPIGGIIFGNEMKLMTEKADQYSACGITVNANKWIHMEATLKLAEGSYAITVTDDEGNVTTSKSFMLASEALPAFIQLGNSYPIGNIAYVDNLLVACDEKTNTSGRQNVLADQGAVTLKGAELVPAEQPGCIALRMTDAEATLVYKPEKPTEASLLCFDAPAGLDADCLIHNSAGHLVRPVTAGQLPAVGGHFESDDASNIIMETTLTLIGSKGAVLQNLGFWTPYAGNANAASLEFEKKLHGDFRLPVYEGNDPALLMLYNLTEAPMPVRIVLQERKSMKEAMAPREEVLAPGENVISIPVETLPDGEFLVTITDNSPEKGAKGFILRLLRRQVLPEPEPPKTLSLLNKKLFLPDTWQLETADNVEFRQGTCEAYPVTDHPMTEDASLQHGGAAGIDADGRLWLNFYTVNAAWELSSKKWYFGTADAAKPDKWEIHQMAPGEKSPASPPYAVKTLMRFSTAKAQKGADGKEHWRLYRPEQDGPVDVSQMEVKHIPFQAPGKVGYESMEVWEDITPPSRTHWPTWHKGPGQSLVLGREPILADGYPGGLEVGNESNDNYAGQWYAPEEKAFFFAHGRILRRYEPLNVPYDNLPRISRLVNVFRTYDGLHYDRAYVALPTMSDPVGSQHYGALFFRDNDGGPYCGLVAKYVASDQRICNMFAYSWDGFNWKTFRDAPPFHDNTPPGQWASGYIGSSNVAFTQGGKLYWLLNWQGSGYHFYGDMSGKEITGENIKKTFAGRGLENWPLFKYFDNDYDKLAEDMKKSWHTPGFMILRDDGFFYAEGRGDRPATFTTRPILAPQASLTVNAVVAKGGYLQVAIVDANGKKLAAKKLGEGDYMDAPLGLTAPAELYKVQVEMKDTKLYTIGFPLK